MSSAAAAAAAKQKRTNLDVKARQAVIAELLRTSESGVVKKGAFTTAMAALFKTNRHSIARLWKARPAAKGRRSGES